MRSAAGDTAIGSFRWEIRTVRNRMLMANTIEVQSIRKESEAWKNYVDCEKKASNYHQYGWRDVVERSFGHKTFYLMAREGEKVKGILPLALIRSRIFGNYLGSLPFFNYGGILADDLSTARALLEAARAVAIENAATYIELRHIEGKDLDLTTRQHKVTMILDLEKDSNSQWKAFNPKLRNQIRKAEKSGLSFRVSGADGLPEFYEVFARNMRDLGTPVYSRIFFDKILEVFPRSTRISSVLHNGQIIAAGIVSTFRDTVEVPWASSLRECKSLCPNNLLYWGTIRLAIEEGFRRFDFGRSSTDAGTYKFKEQWGSRPVPLHWQYWAKEGESLPFVSPSNPKYRLAVAIWRKLPLGLTKLLGPPIVRNIP